MPPKSIGIPLLLLPQEDSVVVGKYVPLAPPVALKDSWWLKRSGGESFDVSLKIAAAAANIISTIFYTIYVDHMKNFVVLPAKNNNQ